MKTVIVVYTNKKLTQFDIDRRRKCPFNTEYELKEGDMISSPTYTTTMQVVKVLEETFVWNNRLTGNLSNQYNSLAQLKIRNLVFRDDDIEIVYANIVKQ